MSFATVWCKVITTKERKKEGKNDKKNGKHPAIWLGSTAALVVTLDFHIRHKQQNTPKKTKLL